MGKQKGEKLGQGETKEDMFNGNGITFKCKLFGSTLVSAARGNDMCAEAIAKLKGEALLRKKESKAHKPRIFLNISIKGIRILDEKTRKLEHAHLIHRISFICHDATDKRSFGYIVSLKEGYTLFAFRTEKAAQNITSSLKELFDVVFKIYSKKKAADGGSVNTSAVLKDHSPVDQAEEATESAYDVPSVVMTGNLIDASENEAHYKVPASNAKFQETFGESPAVSTDETENPFDWSALNDNIAIMQTSMKHSDSADLLADLTNANFDEFTPFTPDDGSDPFGMNPFSPSNKTADDKKSQPIVSQSDTSLTASQSNPFSSPNSQTSGQVDQTKSLGFSENQSMTTAAANNPFNVTAQPRSSDTMTGDLNDLNFAFSSVSTGQSTTAASYPSSDLFDSAPSVNDNVLSPTVMTGGTEPTPSNDPFASLSTNIDTIRSDLPKSGLGSPSFNSARTKSPEPVTLNSLAASSSQSRASPQPIIPKMQMQPVHQQQPLSQGMMPQYGQPSYQMRPSANNPFANAPTSMQQNNMMRYQTPTAYNPSQMQQSPGFGNPHQPNNALTNDPLYATVDKSSSDPFAHLMSQSKMTPTKTQNQNDLVGFDLLQ